MAEDVEGPETSFSDVTPASGYTFEGKVRLRNSNGYGGTQTQLPVGHLARRDTAPRLKRIALSGRGSDDG